MKRVAGMGSTAGSIAVHKADAGTDKIKIMSERETVSGGAVLSTLRQRPKLRLTEFRT